MPLRLRPRPPRLAGAALLWRWMGLVSTLAEAEKKLRELERDAEEMRSREFRALAQEYINDMREMLNTLRRFDN